MTVRSHPWATVQDRILKGARGRCTAGGRGSARGSSGASSGPERGPRGLAGAPGAHGKGCEGDWAGRWASEQDLRRAGGGPLRLRLALLDRRQSWLGPAPRKPQRPRVGGSLSVTCVPPPLPAGRKHGRARPEPREDPVSKDRKHTCPLGVGTRRTRSGDRSLASVSSEGPQAAPGSYFINNVQASWGGGAGWGGGQSAMCRG